MILKMYQILEFQSLYNEIKDEKMSVKTAYKFSKLVFEFNSEIKFYQNKLQEILQKYGEKDEGGNFKLTENKEGVMVKQENIAQCQIETRELHDLDIKIPDISFTLDELENLNITIQQMNIIMPFFEV